jgi:hypothetical protein
MDSFREQILILLGAPFYVAIIGLEVILSNYSHHHLYTWKDTLTNIYLMILNSLLDLIFKFIYLVIQAIFTSIG